MCNDYTDMEMEYVSRHKDLSPPKSEGIMGQNEDQRQLDFFDKLSKEVAKYNQNGFENETSQWVEIFYLRHLMMLFMDDYLKIHPETVDEFCSIALQRAKDEFQKKFLNHKDNV